MRNFLVFGWALRKNRSTAAAEEPTFSASSGVSRVRQLQDSAADYVAQVKRDLGLEEVEMGQPAFGEENHNFPSLIDLNYIYCKVS